MVCALLKYSSDLHFLTLLKQGLFTFLAKLSCLLMLLNSHICIFPVCIKFEIQIFVQVRTLLKANKREQKECPKSKEQKDSWLGFGSLTELSPRLYYLVSLKNTVIAVVFTCLESVDSRLGFQF